MLDTVLAGFRSMADAGQQSQGMLIDRVQKMLSLFAEGFQEQLEDVKKVAVDLGARLCRVEVVPAAPSLEVPGLLGEECGCRMVVPLADDGLVPRREVVDRPDEKKQVNVTGLDDCGEARRRRTDGLGVGVMVVLKGLSLDWLNGVVGRIVTDEASGRFGVEIEAEDEPKLCKAVRP